MQKSFLVIFEVFLRLNTDLLDMISCFVTAVNMSEGTCYFGRKSGIMGTMIFSYIIFFAAPLPLMGIGLQRSLYIFCNLFAESLNFETKLSQVNPGDSTDPFYSPDPLNPADRENRVFLKYIGFNGSVKSNGIRIRIFE